MLPLDEPKLEILVRVCVLHAAAPEVLSAAEAEMLLDLSTRSLELDSKAEVTIGEWDVVLFALEALTAAVRAKAIDLTPEIARTILGDSVKLPSEAIA